MSVNLNRPLEKLYPGYLLILFIVELLVLVVSGIFSVWLAPVLTLLLVVAFMVLNIRIDSFSCFLFLFIIIPFLPLLPPRMGVLFDMFGMFLVTVFWLRNVVDNDLNLEPVPKGLMFFLISYIIICLLSTINSISFSTSFTEFLRLSFLFFFLVVSYYSITSIKQINKILNASILMVILVSIISLPDILSIHSSDIVSGVLVDDRLKSFYSNANIMSIPFMFASPVVFTKIFYSDKKNSFYIRSFYLILLLFFLYVIILTNSRSALLFIFSSFFVLLLGVKYGSVLIGTSFVIFLALLSFLGKTIIMLLRLERGFTGRDILWKAAIGIIQDYPWLGVGLGNYERIKYKYILPIDFFSKFTRNSEQSGAAHNLLLTVMAENGVIAGILVLFLLLYVLIMAIKLIKITNKKDYKTALFVAISILFGLTIRGFFESGIIIGSARIQDFIYFLIPLVIILRMDKIVKSKDYI